MGGQEFPLGVPVTVRFDFRWCTSLAMDQVLLLPESVLLELDEPPTAPPWEQLAELMIPQGVVVEAEFQEGDTLALEDRNSFDEEWPGHLITPVLPYVLTALQLVLAELTFPLIELLYVCRE